MMKGDREHLNNTPDVTATPAALLMKSVTHSLEASDLQSLQREPCLFHRTVRMFRCSVIVTKS